MVEIFYKDLIIGCKALREGCFKRVFPDQALCADAPL
jgi:hypothetical protein